MGLSPSNLALLITWPGRNTHGIRAAFNHIKGGGLASILHCFLDNQPIKAACSGFIYGCFAVLKLVQRWGLKGTVSLIGVPGEIEAHSPEAPYVRVFAA